MNHSTIEGSETFDYLENLSKKELLTEQGDINKLSIWGKDVNTDSEEQVLFFNAYQNVTFFFKFQIDQTYLG